VSLLKLAPSFINNPPVGSVSSPALFQAGASTSLSAGHDGEGMGGESIPALFSEATEVESKGVWSPRCVTSPARGPVLPVAGSTCLNCNDESASPCDKASSLSRSYSPDSSCPWQVRSV
jgi:hypothetical protein